MRRVKIRIKKEEITQGKARSRKKCPVALAIKRTLGKPATIGSGVGYVRSDSPRIGCAWFDLPPAVQRFIYLFDIGEEVRPITFTLELPTK